MIAPSLFVGLIQFSTTAMLWSAAAVIVGLICGFLLGSSYAIFREPRRVACEKAKLLGCLTGILKSTEQLTSDVDSHNSQLDSVRQSVNAIHAENDLQRVQERLVTEIQAVVSANRQLERDLTESQFELRQRARELDTTRNEARVDQLSGLSNRRAFDELYAYFFANFKARHEPFGLILGDIDYFKRINDAYGHVSGDAVIRRIGDVLRQSTRSCDMVARIGGDEFAILLKGAGEAKCHAFGSRLRAIVGRTNFSIGDAESLTSVTISVGVATPNAEDTKESLMERADRALYRSKELGRNLVHAWDSSNTLINLTQISDATV